MDLIVASIGGALAVAGIMFSILIFGCLALMAVESSLNFLGDMHNGRDR